MFNLMIQRIFFFINAVLGFAFFTGLSIVDHGHSYIAQQIFSGVILICCLLVIKIQGLEERLKASKGE